MTLKAFPFDTIDTTETEYSLLFRQLQDDGIIGAPGSAAAQVTAGSGMTVNVATFDIAILAGFVLYSDAVTPLTPAAGGTQPRIDRAVLRVDPTTNSSAIAILPGTPAASNPTPPALTQVPGGIWEISLAQIAVAANAVNIVAANITDERLFQSTRVGAWTTATRVQVAGRLGFNFTTSRFEFYDGGNWLNVNDWAAITGKPATFPPSPHQHPWTDITNTPATYPPSPHQHDWNGTDIINRPAAYPPIIGGASNQAVAGNDPKLTDARTPLPHKHPWSDITDPPVSGYTHAITDANGYILVTHGRSNPPTSVQLTGGVAGVIPERRTYAVSITSINTFTVRVYRQDTGVPFASNDVDFYWTAWF